MADNEARIEDLYHADSRKLTDDELRRIREAPDEELMRMSGTAHLVPIVESMRRLREAIQDEEHAIKWLTAALVLLTAALLGLGAFEYLRH